MLDAVFSVTVVANGDGIVPRRVGVTERGSYHWGQAAGKNGRPTWRAAPALSFLTWDLAFSGLKWFVFLTKPLNLIGMWFSEVQEQTS